MEDVSINWNEEQKPVEIEKPKEQKQKQSIIQNGRMNLKILANEMEKDSYDADKNH